MENSQQLPWKIRRLALLGCLLAFAWLAVSIVLGLGADHANADDSDESAGLVSGLTHVAGGLVTTVTDVVVDVSSAATDVVAGTTAATTTVVVAPALENVAEVAPELPVAPVVAVAETVTTAVAEVAASGVVAPITDSAVSLVTEIPVVGQVVKELQLDTAVTVVGSSVDDTLAGTAGAVAGVVSATAEAAPGGGSPALPGLPSAPLPLASDPTEGGAATGFESTDAAMAAPALMREFPSVRGSNLAGFAPTAGTMASPPGSAVDHVFSATGLFTLFPLAMPVDFFVTGSGGAGPGAWVLVAFGLFVAYRAWMRRNGLQNDLAPAAPLLATDVSPD